MASNWYVSSVAYTAVAQWQASPHAYSLGDIIRQLAAPAANAERCFRCTTAGTSGASEPAPWTLTNNGTTTTGGAVFTECTGQEAHQRDNGVTNTWTAPAARYNNVSSTGKNVLAINDQVFYSSDHAETQTTSLTLAGPGTLVGPNLWLSVLRTGSVPPVAADVASGASITSSAAAVTINPVASIQGITFNSAGTLTLNNGVANGSQYFKNCALVLTGSAVNILSGQNGSITLDNTTVTVPTTSGLLLGNSSAVTFEWKNTPAALGGATFPTTLFSTSGANFCRIHGVDLSAMGSSNLASLQTATTGRLQFANCKLGTSYSLFTGTIPAVDGPLLEVINCDSGNTNYNNARVNRQGTITTNASTTRVGGATDNTTPISRKLVSVASNANVAVAQLVDFPIPSFFLYFNPLRVGTSVQATIEIISSTTLNINDIWVDIEYPGSASSPLSSFGTSGLATPLSTASAITASGATWNNPPATPVTQKMQVTFTPNEVGLITATVRLAKPSQTVWIDPAIVFV